MLVPVLRSETAPDFSSQNLFLWQMQACMQAVLITRREAKTKKNWFIYMCRVCSRKKILISFLDSSWQWQTHRCPSVIYKQILGYEVIHFQYTSIRIFSQGGRVHACYNEVLEMLSKRYSATYVCIWKRYKMLKMAIIKTWKKSGRQMRKSKTFKSANSLVSIVVLMHNLGGGRKRTLSKKEIYFKYQMTISGCDCQTPVSTGLYTDSRS